MSRMRTGLRPTVPTRHSPTKFPPVSNGLRSSSLPGSANSREPEWANDMVRGIQLKTASKTPLVAAHSPRKTPVGLEEVKAATSVKQHGEMTFSSSQQSMRESAKDKEIEVNYTPSSFINGEGGLIHSCLGCKLLWGHKSLFPKKVLIRDFLPALLALKSTFSLRFLRIR